MGRVMAQAVNRWLLNADACVRCRAMTYEICDEENDIGTGLCPSIIVFPLSIIPQMHHTYYVHLRYHFCQKDNRSMTGNHQTKQRLFQTSGKKECFHIIFRVLMS